MPELPTPAGTIKLALHALPPPLLRPALGIVMGAFRRRHASLFRRLLHLAPATILFDPVDTPHCFLLRIDHNTVALDLAANDQAAMARISGRLDTLLHLLEGRIDSDTLFFSRDVVVSGDTAVAVGFRNTLDGETIGLLEDALHMAGPLAGPARRLVLRFDRTTSRLRQAAARWHEAQHRLTQEARDLPAEHDALAAEVASLREHVASLAAAARRRREARA